MKKVIYVLAVILSINYSFSQVQPTATIPVEGSVKKLNLNDPTGVIITHHGDNISGINKQDKVLWSINTSDLFSSNVGEQAKKYLSVRNASDALNALSPTDVQINNIANTYVAELNKGGSISFINIIDGKILVGAKKDNITIYDYFFLPNTNSIIYLYSNSATSNVGMKSEDIYIGRYDILTEKNVFNTKLKDGQEMLSVFSTDSSSPKLEPQMDNQGNIYLFVNGYLVKINGNNGDLMWERKMTTFGVNDFYLTNNDKYLIQVSKGKGIGGLVGVTTRIMVVNTENGNDVWNETLNVKRPMYFQDMGDNFILASYDGFNIYNLLDGTKKWKKSPKGRTKSVIPTDGGYIFVEDNNMQFIGEDGKEKWKNEVEISDNKEDEVVLLDEVDSKIVYITATYANIVDKNSGKKIWSRNIKLNEKRPTFSTFDKAKNEYILFNDEKLYKFNINSTERPEPFAELKIKYEKETNNFEVKEKGYLISGEREYAMVGPDGKTIAQKTYKESGNRRLYKSLLIGGSMAAGLLGSSYSVTSSNGASYEGGLFVNSKGARDAVNNSADLMETAAYSKFNRPNLSTISDNYLFFFTDESSDVKKVLVQVNKNTGNEVNKYQLDNTKPEYEVDEISNTLYYANDKNIEIFDLSK